ncbi:SPOSA6832_01299 [Sporobolomyces salmonicolor]|uniref:SPOSA6832_01299-mRNA-1:cds n=1 Tax=Sporidiobolus salmonicolor TaxID=5005 RepID=A0A0D6EJ31_SPOSA|nr:SPOSA6832_01299 [Sporobolomyces salmonicolor]
MRKAAPLNLAGSDGPDGVKAWIERALGELVKRQAEGGEAYAGEKMGKQEFVFKLVFSIVLVLLGGVFSGLSLGLMVLAASGPAQDRQDARKVLSLLSHGRHFVLVCLLLSNVIVNETLPVFLDSITGGSGFIAVAVSSALIVIFGEVLPQALCAQYGLRIGAKCVGFVRVLMFLESPICYPTARLLDWLLGVQHVHLYRREELKTLIELHSSPSSLDQRGGLSEVEVDAVRAALGMGERTVEGCMKRKDEVYDLHDGMRVCDVDLKEVMIRSQPYIPVKRARLAQYTAQSKGEEIYVGLVTAAQLRNQDPSAVFLISKVRFNFARIPQDVHTEHVLLGSARTASGSLGIAAFVRGIVNRQRAHRASASSLSFQLSDDEPASSYHPLAVSHSHHHSSSQSGRPPPMRNVGLGTGSPAGLGGAFRFPSPMFEETETFALGEEGEGEADHDSLLQSREDESFGGRQGRGGSGFVEERGIGDPLGADRGSGGGGVS